MVDRVKLTKREREALEIIQNRDDFDGCSVWHVAKDTAAYPRNLSKRLSKDYRG